MAQYTLVNIRGKNSRAPLASAALVGAMALGIGELVTAAVMEANRALEVRTGPVHSDGIFPRADGVHIAAIRLLAVVAICSVDIEEGIGPEYGTGVFQNDGVHPYTDTKSCSGAKPMRYNLSSRSTTFPSRVSGNL